MSAQTRTLALLACLLVGAACDEADDGGTGPGGTTSIEPVISVRPANVELEVGATAQLIGSVEGRRGIALPVLTWTSSDENVATVSLTGMVTARAEGFAIITAASGKQSAFARVNVNAATQAQNGDLPRAKRPIRPF